MMKQDAVLFPGDQITDSAARGSVQVDTVIPWSILVVDDEPDVHQVTQWSLRDFKFDGRPIQIESAYSMAQAVEMLNARNDYAVVLLDVVMEHESAGLMLIHHIRCVMNNRLIRIVLRTGQPGEAPEEKVMMEYDINDYREKTEITASRLRALTIGALRSYRDFVTIDHTRKSLEMIIESLAGMHEHKTISKLATDSLTQLARILGEHPSGGNKPSRGLSALKYGGQDYIVLSGLGEYDRLLGTKLNDTGEGELDSLVRKAATEHRSLYRKDKIALYSQGKQDVESIIYLEGSAGNSAWERALFEVFRMNLDVAFDNILLNKEMETTQKEIIQTLGEAAEARSHETGQHVKRVAEWAWLVARRLGLPPDEAEILRMAAPTHDVGKLGVPDVILNKPGPLTIEEFEIVKQHCRIGYEILRRSERPLMQISARIALEHHEKWDGTGYPNRMKATEAHIYSRIVALADVFDALGNYRVYKEAWPIERIIDYIRAERGHHFDPDVVDVFLNNIEDVLIIRDALPDNVLTMQPRAERKEVHVSQ